MENVLPLIGGLRGIGRNLNQLTTLANMGKVQTAYLDDTKAELSNIFEKISALCEVEK